jgi:cephalosporin hydroxylase
VVRLSVNLVNIKDKINKAKFILKNYGFKVLFFHSLNYILIKLGLSCLDEDFKKWFLKLEKIFRNEILKEEVLDKIKKFNSNNIEEVFEFAFNFYDGLIRPLQVKSEFIELLKIYKELDPKVVMEIGTARGGTLFCFIKLASSDTIFISIDLPFFGIKRYIYKGESYLNSLFNLFVKENQKLYLIRSSSLDKNTINKVKEILGNKAIDFLFIDGDHSYEAVKSDFENYSKFVRKGGIVAFHDIIYSEGVNRIWNEIKSKGTFYRELIKDSNSLGIGVLYL